jgi:hypothetical protein
MMLAFGVGTSLAKDIEEHHVESHRVRGCETQIIEDAPHGIEAFLGVRATPI